MWRIKRTPRQRYFILIVVTILVLGMSLWSRKEIQTAENISYLHPKEGDNFKRQNHPGVYRLEAGKRRPYLTTASYLCDTSNRPFNTPYSEGGILICDSATIYQFPLGNVMPLAPRAFRQQRYWKRFFAKDKLGHLLLYTFFSYLVFSTVFYNLKKQWFEYLFLIVIICLFGLGIECLQEFWTLTRSFEWEDILMNGLGTCLGCLIFAHKDSLSTWLSNMKS